MKRKRGRKPKASHNGDEVKKDVVARIKRESMGEKQIVGHILWRPEDTKQNVRVTGVVDQERVEIENGDIVAINDAVVCLGVVVAKVKGNVGWPARYFSIGSNVPPEIVEEVVGIGFKIGTQEREYVQYFGENSVSNARSIKSMEVIRCATEFKNPVNIVI